MVNLEELKQEIKNQLQINLDNNFYYRDQNPQVPNGFVPIDQVNIADFDREKDNLSRNNAYQRATGEERPIYGPVTRNERRSRQETRYRSEEKTEQVPSYSAPIAERWCMSGNHKWPSNAPHGWNVSGVWCSVCQAVVEKGLKETGERSTYHTTRTYTVQVPYQETVWYTESVTRQEQTDTEPIMAPDWQEIKQVLEQQFTPPNQNQNEYSFIYWNTNNPNEPDLAQIYQSGGGDQFKIVLRTAQKNNSDFDTWKQNVEQGLRERRFNDLFSQQFQQMQDQTNNNLRQERDNLQTVLENERQARDQSRERRQQEFNDRLESDQEVLRDRLGEETAYVVENQRRNWENHHRGRGNN